MADRAPFSGHIPGAINLTLSRFDAAQIPKGKPIVLICQAGSALALMALVVALIPIEGAAQQPAVPVQQQRQQQVQDLTPAEVAKGVTDGRYLLIDVREPDEVADEAFRDALNLPLSRFYPRLIPDSPGRQVVLACHTGRRSTVASLGAQAAGVGYNKQLAGGIEAWKAAGLPTKRGALGQPMFGTKLVPRTGPIAALVLAAAGLGVAYFAEYGFGLQPCELCLTERWAYYLAIPVLLTAFAVRWFGLPGFRIACVLVSLAIVGNAGLGAYHSGVEWQFWSGPDACTGGGTLDLLSGGSLLQRLESATVVPRCDEPAFRFAELSPAGYNVLWSLLIAACAGFGVRRPPHASA